MKFMEFVDRIDAFLKKNGYQLKLLDRSFMFEKQKNIRLYHTGVFDEESKEIRVAFKSSKWREVLIHEYCHFLQLKNNTECYQKSNSYNNVDQWMNSKEHKSENSVLNHFKNCIAYELEAETLALRLIRGLKLEGIKESSYIRNANRYLDEWGRAFEYRKWGHHSSSKILKKEKKRLFSVEEFLFNDYK